MKLKQNRGTRISASVKLRQCKKQLQRWHGSNKITHFSEDKFFYFIIQQPILQFRLGTYCENNGLIHLMP